MCNLGALSIRLHQLVSGGRPVSVRASTRTGQVHSGHCGRRGQEESDAWSLKFRRRSLKFRHGVTLVCGKPLWECRGRAASGTLSAVMEAIVSSRCSVPQRPISTKIHLEPCCKSCLRSAIHPCL